MTNKSDERAICEQGIKDAQEMLQYFTMKAANEMRPDKKNEYNSFVRQWKLTLESRQTEWNTKHKTKP